MKDNLDISDVRLIIRNLITFIVIEGKEYVSDANKRAYVSGYVHTLIRTINLIDEHKEFSITEDIVEDISKYLE